MKPRKTRDSSAWAGTAKANRPFFRAFMPAGRAVAAGGARGASTRRLSRRGLRPQAVPPRSVARTRCSAVPRSAPGGSRRDPRGVRRGHGRSGRWSDPAPPPARLRPGTVPALTPGGYSAARGHPGGLRECYRKRAETPCPGTQDPGEYRVTSPYSYCIFAGRACRATSPPGRARGAALPGHCPENGHPPTGGISGRAMR